MRKSSRVGKRYRVVRDTVLGMRIGYRVGKRYRVGYACWVPCGVRGTGLGSGTVLVMRKSFRVVRGYGYPGEDGDVLRRRIERLN